MSERPSFQGFNGGKLPVNGEHAPVLRVLVAVDLLSNTSEVIRCARFFAKQFDAVIEFLHVVQLSIVGEERGVPRTNLIQGLAQKARSELCKLIEDFLDESLISMVVVREGRADKVILQEAHVTNAMMIVMGSSHGRRLSRLLGRCTSDLVIRHAPCPVLVVRPGHSLKFPLSLLPQPPRDEKTRSRISGIGRTESSTTL
jgi:universal stress protein A